MKTNQMILPIALALASSVASEKISMAYVGHDEIPAVRFDCVEQIQNAIGALNEMESTHPQIKKTTVQYASAAAEKVLLKGNGFTGTAKVRPTRGGCFITSLNVKSTQN